MHSEMHPVASGTTVLQLTLCRVLGLYSYALFGYRGSLIAASVSVMQCDDTYVLVARMVQFC